ncbi:hypothetical protein [Algicola sagamiensis]|uniref:hypothetical protein n=1 Tax=Algicola sagamiensis TaxID=163869 RepID=UPI00036D1611|nr:hypothetical protein [Algicola sagamiensis]
MNAIISNLEATLKDAYRKAVDADTKLEQLQRSGMGKFSTIFATDSGFQQEKNRFMPYVEELAADILALKSEDESVQQAKLPLLLKKLELMFSTLHRFKTSL